MSSTDLLAAEQVQVAAALRQRYTETGEALAEGSLSYEQAKAIAFVGDHLPKQASAQDKAWAQEFLLKEAAKLDGYDLRKLGEGIDAAIDPDGVLDREKAAAQRRAGNIRDNHDGTQTMRVRETDENVALVKAAITATVGTLHGETRLEDTGLYCSHHHGVIHAQGWETELGPDGRPQLRPPAWLDPERTPIRNTYWQRQQELRLDLGRDRGPDDQS